MAYVIYGLGVLRGIHQSDSYSWAPDFATGLVIILVAVTLHYWYGGKER